MHNLAGTEEEWDAAFLGRRWAHLADPEEGVRYEGIARLVASRAPHPDVLDLGCGTGLLARAFGPELSGRYVGVDWSVVALREARAGCRKSDRFIHADLDRWTPDGSFAVIVLSEILYYLADPLGLVRRCLDHLRPDGLVVVSMYMPRDRARATWRSFVKEIAAKLVDEHGARMLTSLTSASGRAWLLLTLEPAAIGTRAAAQ